PAGSKDGGRASSMPFPSPSSSAIMTPHDAMGVFDMPIYGRVREDKRNHQRKRIHSRFYATPSTGSKKKSKPSSVKLIN
ncbi:MAG TPA: hypothetical protein PKJ72_13835, partial [Deltaproteobacteria bacterium]|nr:hypothetical protein [Deltaproteobacteria bacterium]